MSDNSEVSELQRLANDKRNYGTDGNQITYEQAGDIFLFLENNTLDNTLDKGLVKKLLRAYLRSQEEIRKLQKEVEGTQERKKYEEAVGQKVLKFISEELDYSPRIYG